MGGGGKHSSALLTGYNQSATLNHILEQFFFPMCNCLKKMDFSIDSRKTWGKWERKTGGVSVGEKYILGAKSSCVTHNSYIIIASGIELTCKQSTNSELQVRSKIFPQRNGCPYPCLSSTWQFILVKLRSMTITPGVKDLVLGQCRIGNPSRREAAGELWGWGSRSRVDKGRDVTCKL